MHISLLSCGRSFLVLDYVIARDNPADAGMFPTQLDCHKATFPRPRGKLAGDGGFTSREDLRVAKSQGVRNVMFAKRRGFGVLDMVKIR